MRPTPGRHGPVDRHGPADRPGLRRRRQPAVLPPAILDDSLAAAEYLVRRPGALLLVDGYNVSMVGWSGRTLVEQRSYLIGALAEVVARVGVRAHVVFDGDSAPSGGWMPPRQAVRVSFSPPDVEADEVIIELVAASGHQGPVLVATNDRRVRDEVRLLGANVLSAEQLLATLGRRARP